MSDLLATTVMFRIPDFHGFCTFLINKWISISVYLGLHKPQYLILSKLEVPWVQKYTTYECTHGLRKNFHEVVLLQIKVLVDLLFFFITF
jgi:hypothetical protein